MISFLDGLQSLQTEPLSPIYVLLGSETCLHDEFVRCVVERDADDRGVDIAFERYVFDDDGAQEALLSLSSVSLFDDAPVVYLNRCGAFLSTSREKQDSSALEAYLQNPIAHRILLISVVAQKWDERKKLTKAAKLWPVIHCEAEKDVEAIRILSMLVERGRRGQGETPISREILQEVWRRTASISVAMMELIKLVTYKGSRNIGLADVDALVVRPLDDNVFDWVDHVVGGRADAAISTISDLLQTGHDGFALLALLARQFRLLWFAKSLGFEGQSDAQIAKQAGAHPFAVKVARRQAQRVTVQQLETALLKLADAEFDVKRGRKDILAILQEFVLWSAWSSASSARA